MFSIPRPLRVAGCALAAIAAGLLTTAPASASTDYPQRPIRMVIPFPPGGSLDPIGRIMSEELSKALGQSVIVENVAGAGGTLGSARVATSAPDGYTVLVGITSNMSLAPLVMPGVRYTSDNFDAISLLGTSGLVLLARPDLPANNLAEVIALARAQPDTLSYGVPGAGSLYHLVMETLLQRTDSRITSIPYKGAGQASVDLIGGQIDLALLGLPAMLNFIDSKRLKPIAVMSGKRDIGNESIPTAAETPGLENIDYTIWTGIFTPKGTPEPIRAKLHDAISTILARPDVIKQYRDMGVAVAEPMTMEAFGKFVQSENEKLARDVRDNDFKPAQ